MFTSVSFYKQGLDASISWLTLVYFAGKIELHLKTFYDAVEGQTFGEIALINPDCIRTASVVADEETDLVVIDRDLYNRSVSQVRIQAMQ